MLKVFYRSDEEIETARYRVCRGKPFCPTYVITKDHKEIDTDQLNEEQILAFVRQGIRQSSQEKRSSFHPNDGNYDLANYESANEVNLLLYAVHDTYRPTWDGMKTIVKLLHNQDQIVRGFAQQVLPDTAKRGKYDMILDMATYRHENHDCDHEVTVDELLQVIDDLAIREKATKEQ